MANAGIDQNSRPTLTALASDGSGEIVYVYANKTTHRLLVDNAGSGITELPATGTVNGVNAAFTFTQQPSYIVSDHAWYKPTNKSGTTNWTWNSGTLTATLTIPPTEDVFGVA